MFCDLGCKMSLDKIPCGIPVTNQCDRLCNQVGQGLNLRHCLLNVAKTACNEPVTDNCNNVCGFLGQKDCDGGTDATTLGALVINSFDRVSDTSYRLSVGALEPAPDTRPMDNALYLDFMQQGQSVPVSGEEDSVRPAAILKMEYMKEELVTRELQDRPREFRTAHSESNSETERILPKEGIEFKAPSDTARNGGTPHAVRVTMFSEFTGGYVKVGQGHEEPTSHHTRTAAAVGILAGTHSFSAQKEAGGYGWGSWSPELRRIPWLDSHQHIRLDQPGLEAYSFMAWVQRASGGRGFAVRKVLRGVGDYDPARLNHPRPEKVEQCWAWYFDGVPAFHFGGHDYTGAAHAAGTWSDRKLHLEALVVNKSHVLMYQDLRLVGMRTLWDAYNSTDLPFTDCQSSAGMNVSLQVGGSGLKVADVKYFPHALSLAEMNSTFIRGLSSSVAVDSSIGNAFRGWMPRQPGSHTSHDAVEAQVRLSDANPVSAQDMLNYSLFLDKMDVNRSRARDEITPADVGAHATERHFLGGENTRNSHRAVNDGFQIVQQNTGDRAAWGYRNCPFLFNAGAPKVPDVNNDLLADYTDANLVRVCLDEPTSKQHIRLPDAVPDPLSTPSRPLPMGSEFERSLPHRQGSMPWTRTYATSSKQHGWLPSLSGVIITTGNMHDLAGLPGLMSRVPSISFSGTAELLSKPEERLYAYTALSPARLRCCPLNDTQNLSSGIECFNSSAYQHKWGLKNIDVRSQNGTVLLKQSTSLRTVIDAPWWFFETWLYLNGSAVAQRVPPDIYNYIFPNRTCYWLNETTVSNQTVQHWSVCNYSDANQSRNAREDSFLSFVKRPGLEPFADLNLTLMLNGKGPKFDVAPWKAADERLRGPFNQTRNVNIAQGCEIYNMSSHFFDFFRIYYKVEGWEDVIRKLVFKLHVLYPNSSHAPSAWAAVTAASISGLEADPFFHEQDFLSRWKTEGDYWNTSWILQSEAKNASEWTEAVASSRSAAFALREMMEWRDEQRPYQYDFGAKMHLVVLMGGLRTSPHNMTGYYIRENTTIREERPVYRQLLLPRDIAQGRTPNYIYATTEWYSNLEVSI